MQLWNAKFSSSKRNCNRIRVRITELRVLKMNLNFALLLLFLSLVLSEQAGARAKSIKHWNALVYTGDKLWSGTDSDILLQINGLFAKTRTFHLKPSKGQLETKSVDNFSLGQFDLEEIGPIQSMTIIKEANSGIINDWYLNKIEINDANSTYNYEFVCNCWFTTRYFNRTIKINKSPNDLLKLGRIVGWVAFFLVVLTFVHFIYAHHLRRQKRTSNLNHLRILANKKWSQP